MASLPDSAAARQADNQTVAYAELHCVSNFSFLRGASHPEELVEQAAKLNYQAVAITDECSVAGVVRAYTESKEHDIKLIIGSEFRCQDGPHLVMLATTRAAYTHLCHAITRARRNAEKGSYCIDSETLAQHSSECVVIWLPEWLPGGLRQQRKPAHNNESLAINLKSLFGTSLWLGAELIVDGNDPERLAYLSALAESAELPMVACGNVHMHVRGRRALQDTVTAIRLKTTVERAGFELHANGERHLRSLKFIAALYPQTLRDNTLLIANQCNFSLGELKYEYPDEVVPEGMSAQQHLRELTYAGAAQRWPEGISEHVRQLVEHELALIAELNYEKYFLTVHDIVRFARSQAILCQGRGSAANSSVCFCLGITEVDPARMAMLFERFISKERNEPPDIDVDFEHERREEVIQYIYAKYGRERAALTATVISYRPRSAMRDIAKALGLDDLQTGRLARSMQWWDGRRISAERVREAGFDPDNPVIHRILTLVREIQGFPRHLSQHVGGFVISRGPLYELVPVENALMPERTVIQWDKDDLDDLGLLKVDVLGLGMLTAIRRSFDLINNFRDRQWTLATVPAEDPMVYEMISRGDTVGVFQIESRAQMAMLPRLKPQCFYDLVIEVAIVRPGPIQGDMVHPYLRRRNGEEPVSYPSEEVKEVLQRTLGVPIFQEQVMHLAMVAAGFTPGEADRLRRAMAAWKRKGGLGPFEERLINGMKTRGYQESFAEQVFKQIKGFGEYGFPESHSASFALLVYVSAWLKRYEPAAFFCAMLNSLPMGFYAPAQLVRAARQHQVEVLPVAVNQSYWDCSLEADENGTACLRLGFSRIKGFAEEAALTIEQCREQGLFIDAADVAHRAALNKRDMELLASSDALKEFANHRYRARWQVAGIEAGTPLMPRMEIREAEAILNKPGDSDDVTADYQYLGLSLSHHPVALLRPEFSSYGLSTAEELWQWPPGRKAHIVGLVIARQRPGTASGVTFVTLEDESGHVNLIVWKAIGERYRKALVGARLMRAIGEIQKESGVLHFIVDALYDETPLLGSLSTASRDFH